MQYAVYAETRATGCESFRISEFCGDWSAGVISGHLIDPPRNSFLLSVDSARQSRAYILQRKEKENTKLSSVSYKEPCTKIARGTGGDLFLFTHLTVEVSFLFIYLSSVS